jgi:hypothetical protein
VGLSRRSRNSSQASMNNPRCLVFAGHIDGIRPGRSSPSVVRPKSPSRWMRSRSLHNQIIHTQPCRITHRASQGPMVRRQSAMHLRPRMMNHVQTLFAKHHRPPASVTLMGVTGPGQSQDTHPHSTNMVEFNTLTQCMLTLAVTGPGQSQDTHPAGLRRILTQQQWRRRRFGTHQWYQH